MNRYRLVVFALLITMVFQSCKSNSVLQTAKKEGESAMLTKNDLEINFHFMNGIKEKNIGNPEEAVSNFRRCLAVDPTHAAASYELGLLMGESGNLEMLEYFSRNAYKQNPENIWYGKLYAEALIARDKRSDASDIYRKLEQLPDANQDLVTEHVALLALMRKEEEALDVLLELEKKTGPTLEISLQKQRLFLQQGKVGKAVEEVEQLIKLDPNEIRYYLLLSELYSANNFPDKAREALEKGLLLEPENPAINLTIAESYRVKKEYEAAQPYLIKAFNSTDLDIDSKVQILLAYYMITELSPEHKPLANELVDITTVTHPTSAKSWSIAGDFAYRDKEFKKAQERFMRALDYDKGKYPVWSQLLVCDSELADFTMMEQHGKEAVELFPNEPSAWLLYSIALIQLKNDQKALETLSAGKNLVIDNQALEAQFYANLGDVNHRLKKFDDSDKAYEAALAINPNDTYVLNNYAYYLSLRKDKLDKAEAMSLKTNELSPGNASYQDTYGWILFESGKHQEALKWLLMAEESGGRNNSVILEHIGDAYFKLNNSEKANEYWEKAASASKEPSEGLQRRIKERAIPQP